MVMATTQTYMTTSTAPKNMQSSDSAKPTLLAFHGSGSNATVHTVQLARLMRAIKPHFNVESVEAPFPSPAGPGVLPFFDGCGPFKRWLPPSEKITLEAMRRGESTAAMSPEVENLVLNTIREVRAEGGHVVGLIGFSQGTKVVSGLLRGMEIVKALKERGEDVGEEADLFDFKFALSVCASYPPPLLPPKVSALLENSHLDTLEKDVLLSRKIETPVFHVQGKRDEWNWAGKSLIEGHYAAEKGQSQVVEWDMGHHYPVPAEESEMISEWMLTVLGQSGQDTVRQ